MSQGPPLPTGRLSVPIPTLEGCQSSSVTAPPCCGAFHFPLGEAPSAQRRTRPSPAVQHPLLGALTALEAAPGSLPTLPLFVSFAAHGHQGRPAHGEGEGDIPDPAGAAPLGTGAHRAGCLREAHSGEEEDPWGEANGSPGCGAAPRALSCLSAPPLGSLQRALGGSHQPVPPP